MEQAKSPSKVRFAFVWSVLWGGLTALAITLFNWYTTQRIETGYQVAGRFAIFTASGIVLGLFMWNRRQALDNRKLTRSGNIVRLVLFISLMLGLSYVLWTMAHHSLLLR